ncbi:adenosylcobinamide amidohydrolase [Natronosalvus rutilus]|uniref:Adenosylcobinamide amidohydrolase n=1 Tax=Natronosalvus rutilus TaxID=2953753 RepID=A0A9E7NDV9_9EURY|nr:adenosylcobinamide amidohydrolase [Natronosalvus rutilus]UTF55144.1 adenosylcobinamide amidohydrolase [Natronosalvus rutilus]
MDNTDADADADGDTITGYQAERTDGILCAHRPGIEWLSSGWNGGRSRTDRAFNVSVPEGWCCDNLDRYVEERLERAGFADGRHDRPVLLTGVDLAHARGARCGSVTVYATAGISNPAALPMDPDGGLLPDGRLESDSLERSEGSNSGNGGDDGDEGGSERHAGTVNLIVGTTHALEAGALESLLAVAAEAKAATLLARTGFPGTTTDAIVVGHDPSGSDRAFSGSATAVGAAARACVREAITASLASRYEGTDATIPASVSAAEYGVSTDARATVFRL